MFGIQGFMSAFTEPLPPEERERREKERQRRIDEDIARNPFQPWDAEKTSWKPELRLKADSYQVRRFFDVKPTRNVFSVGSIEAKPEERVLSSDKEWMYCEKALTRGERLTIYTGMRQGQVWWDGDVTIPCLYYKRFGCWENLPFMSLTPFEYMTLRTGTKRAKGRVVVAGLGLGHQLIEVSRRKSVKEIVLVEQSQSLVDFILPEVRKHLGPAGATLEVIVGDAFTEMQSITADVALVDIFPGYGGNDYEQDKLRRTCSFIDTIWCWGAGKR